MARDSAKSHGIDDGADRHSSRAVALPSFGQPNVISSSVRMSDLLAVDHGKDIEPQEITPRSTVVQCHEGARKVRQQDREYRIEYATNYITDPPGCEAAIEVEGVASRHRDSRSPGQRHLGLDDERWVVDWQFQDCRRTGEGVRDVDAVEKEIGHQLLDAGNQGSVTTLKLSVDIDWEITIRAAAALSRGVTIAEGTKLHLVSSDAWRGLLALLLTQYCTSRCRLPGPGGVQPGRGTN